MRGRGFSSASVSTGLLLILCISYSFAHQLPDRSSVISHHRLVRLGSRSHFDETTSPPASDLAGGIANAPGYGIFVGVGSADGVYLLSLDTGSADLAIVGTGCMAGTKACATPDAPYDPRRSNSSESVACQSESFSCKNCSASDTCELITSYADGSYITGTLYNDVIYFLQNGSESNTTSFVGGRADFAVISNSSAHFFGGGSGGLDVDGILGLAYRNLSATGAAPLLDSLVSLNVTADLFSLCLGDNGGWMVIGALNESLGIEPVRYTPFTAPNGLYEISPNAIFANDLGNYTVNMTDMNVIVDSGTTLLLLPESIYDSLMLAFPKWCASHEDSYLLCNPNTNLLNLYKKNPKKKDVCLNFHALDLENMPNLTFSFPLSDNSGQSFEVSLTAREYVRYETSSDNSWDYCGELGIGVNRNSNFTLVLGDVFLKGFYAVFDREMNRFGLARQNATMCGGYATIIIPKTHWLEIGFAGLGVAVILLVLIIIWAVARARNKAGYQPIN